MALAEALGARQNRRTRSRAERRSARAASSLSWLGERTTTTERAGYFGADSFGAGAGVGLGVGGLTGGEAGVRGAGGRGT